MTDTMLNISRCALRYGDVSAFRNISLTVPEGKMVSIIGESGCGKTSLLLAISGLLPVDSGSIAVKGGERVCSIMFQQDRLLPWKPVLDNVLIGTGRRELAGAAMDLLQSFGLGGFENKFPGQLSGGERQRVALARSLVRKPALLLLDEPMAALDEQTRERLQDDIKRYISDNGITMVLVTHSIREAVFMGEEIAVMNSEGMGFSIDNPYHSRTDLRSMPECFELERVLRRALRESGRSAGGEAHG